MQNCTYNSTTTGLIPVPCNYAVGSANLVDGVVDYNSYGYFVNTASTYVFVVLFGLALLLHLILSLRYRCWFALFTYTLGAAIETLGWAGRLWSVRSRWWDVDGGGIWMDNDNGFIMQITCLVIAPTFFSAGNYILLSKLVRAFPQCSLVTPRSMAVIFTLADVICLVIQGLGGGMTGTADDNNSTMTGLHVMAVGVVAQLAITALFIASWAEFIHRFRTGRPTQRHVDLAKWLRWPRRLSRERRTAQGATTPPTPAGGKEGAATASLPWTEGDPAPVSTRQVTLLLCALGGSTLLIVVRSIYRADELLSFSATSNTGAYYDQNLFIGLDACLMFLLLVLYLVIHPSILKRQTIMPFARGTV